MNNKWMILFFTAVLVPAAFAVSGVTLTASNDTFFLNTNTTISTQLTLQNNSGERLCFSARTDTEPNGLEATLTPRTVCLNNRENTTLTLTFGASEQTRTGTYTIDVVVVHGLGRETEQFTVNVRENPQIQITPRPVQEYCTNQTIFIPIDVKNTGDSEQRVELSASASAFLPSLSETILFLDPNETRTIEMRIPTNRTTPEGTFTYHILSRTQGQQTSQAFSFTTLDCEEEPVVQTSFEITTPTNCLNISPGQTNTANVDIRNTGTTPITIWFNAPDTPDLDVEVLTASPISLSAGSQRAIDVRIRVPSGIVTEGAKTIRFEASSTNQTQRANICVIALRPFELTARPNAITVYPGERFGVALTLENNWNTSQTISLNVSDRDPDTRVSFSQTNISLQPYQQLTVMATITVDDDAVLGGHSIEFRANNSNGTEIQRVFFSVISFEEEPEPPLPEPEEGILEIRSYPASVMIAPGESKELRFLIFNTSQETLEGLHLNLIGLPDGVSFARPLPFNLSPEAAIPVVGLLSVDSSVSRNQEFLATLVVTNEQARTLQTLRIRILIPAEPTEERSDWDTFISGLIGFGSSGWGLGLIILILLILLLAWLNSHHARRQYIRHTEHWRRYLYR